MNLSIADGPPTCRGEFPPTTWLLFKKRGEFARSKADYDVVSASPDSVIAKPPSRPPAPPSSAPSATVKAGAPTPRLAE